VNVHPPKTPPSIFHIPHASRVIPSDLQRVFLLTDDELNDQILRRTDHFTDELFDLSGEGIARVV
jgi:N-formylglutamate amidohydrolase